MPLFWLSLAFLAGILIGDYSNGSTSLWLWLSGVLLVLSFCVWLLPTRFIGRLRQFTRFPKLKFLPEWALPSYSILWLFLALSLGGLRFVAHQPRWAPDFIAWHNDQDISLVMEGVIVDPPVRMDGVTRLRIRVERLHKADESVFQRVDGLILARVPPLDGWRYGDRVRLEGKLETPPAGETFSYRDYLSRQGIFAYFSCYVCQGCATPVVQECARLIQHDQGNPIRALIYNIREKAFHLVNQFLPDPEASLLTGILLGIEERIPEKVDQAFRDTGTAHIIAISGFNFAIVAGLFSSLFTRLLGRWRGMLAAFLGMVIYAVLAGANAAVVRAAIMGSFSVFAQQLGRRQHGLNTLLIVAAIMALADPNVLWDVGFQLSFTATLGLVLYAQPLQEWFTAWGKRFFTEERVERLAGPVGEYLLFTVAAQITTLPVIVYHFQRLSLVSLLANPLILPAQPPVMILGGLAALLGMAAAPLGQIAAYLVWPFLIYTIRLVEWFASLNKAVWVLGSVTLLVVALYYLILFALTILKSQPSVPGQKSAMPSWVSIGGMIGLLAITLLTWQAVILAPDGRLHVTVLDVGSGEALLIQTPGGRYVLVDGGPSATRLSDALGRRLPVWGGGLDTLVVAATGPEQVGGLPYALERFTPRQTLWAGPATGDYTALSLRRILTQKQIPMTQAQSGYSLDLGQGASLEVLAVTRRGMVLLLSWERFQMLMPIGADFENMAPLMRNPRYGEFNVLLLAESGYGPLNPPEWIQRWNPQLVLVSVAAGDYDHRPATEVLEVVKGYPLLRTDQNGWIELTTDGELLWIEVEKQ